MVPRKGGAVMAELPAQVVATDLAIHLIRTLRAKHGPLMFHQSGGCCDGSSPMCYPRGEFLTGTRMCNWARWTANRFT